MFASEPHQRSVEPVRVDLPVQLGSQNTRPHDPLAEELGAVPPVEPDQFPRVIVQPDEVLAGWRSAGTTGPAQREGQPALPERAQDALVEHPLEGGGNDAVLRGKPARGIKDAQVVGEADPDVTPSLFHPLVGQPVASQHGHEHPDGGPQVPRPGRPLAFEEPLVGDDGRLVDGDPIVGELSELRHHAVRVAREAFGRFWRAPAAGVGDPGRIGEVVQRHERPHAARPERLQDLRVVVDGVGGELAGGRLDPTPLQREAMGVLMQSPEQVEIVDEAAVVIAGRVGPIAVTDMAGNVLPGPPVVAMVAALDLVGGGRGAPEEVGGKSRQVHAGPAR